MKLKNDYIDTVTEVEKGTDSIREQPSKAKRPMLVTLLGIVTDVRPEQPLKAELLIAFVPELTMTEVFWGIEPLYLYNTLPR